MSASDVADRLNVSKEQVVKWRKEAGITYVHQPTRRMPGSYKPALLTKTPVAPEKDSVAAGAAMHLRKIYPNVYHRVIHGKEFQGFYQVGKKVMTTADMIVHAKEKGFVDWTSPTCR